MTRRAPLLLLVAAAPALAGPPQPLAAPPTPVASVAATVPVPGAGLHATVRLRVTVDEDRFWITEWLDVAPDGPRAVALSVAQRRFAVPPGAGGGGRGGLRYGTQGQVNEVPLEGGAVLLPAEIGPEGATAALEYSLAAAEDTLRLERRYPVPVLDATVSATATFPGLRIETPGGPAGRGVREGPTTWISRARRAARLEAGAPLTVTFSNMPAYRVPLWAKAILLFAAHVAGIGALAHVRRKIWPGKRKS